uniref:DBIRD complex subunit ZNF326-like n=1 Tax=Myxine glutinosa TaxID=7769 RepID=UPI00358F6295
MYCALCNFNTLETKDMDAHMESDQHKSSLLLVDKHFPKDKMLSRFLNERMRMLNKKIEIRKRSWEKEHGGSDKTNLTLTGADIPDCMQQMDVVRCPACRTFIPALEWEVQAHLQSVRHASIFQYVQQKNFDKIRDIGVKVLRKQGGNMQYEDFKKGGDPFAAEILALERREEQKETLAKGEEQKETLAKGEEQKETLAKAEEEKETLAKAEEEKETLAKAEEEKETLVKGEEEKETLVKGEEEKETLAKGEEEKTLVKGVSKAKRLPKVKKMLNKNVQNNGQEDEKEKSLEEDRTKDEQEQQGTKIGSVKAKDDKIEEKEEEENDRDVLEQRDFEVSGDSDKGEGEEEGTDEEERHLLNFEEEEEEDGGIV